MVPGWISAHLLDVRVGEHLIVVGVGHLRLMGSRNLGEYVFGRIADRIQLGVARFSSRIKVGRLRDRSGARHATCARVSILGSCPGIVLRWYTRTNRAVRGRPKKTMA